ncbi:MAG: arylesterase [Bacteroidota bacterium]
MYKGLLTAILLTLSLTAQEDKKTIIFFGDSITAGYGLSKEQAFPALIASSFKDEGLNCEILNAGLSGETSAGGLSRIDWILRKPVDVFVLELGANDGLRGLPLESTKSNLQKIIDKVKEQNPNVALVIAGMMVPPNLGSEYSKEFEEIFPDLARANDAILIPFLLDGIAGNQELNLADGIHPNVEGHRIVAKNIFPVIKKASRF